MYLLDMWLVYSCTWHWRPFSEQSLYLFWSTQWGQTLITNTSTLRNYHSLVAHNSIMWFLKMMTLYNKGAHLAWRQISITTCYCVQQDSPVHHSTLTHCTSIHSTEDHTDWLCIVPCLCNPKCGCASCLTDAVQYWVKSDLNLYCCRGRVSLVMW